MVNQDGTTYIGDRLSPRMLGQRDAGRGQPSPPLYTSRAQAADYAAGWYECSARPAPDTLHPRVVADPPATDMVADPSVTNHVLTGRRPDNPAGQ